MRSKGFTNRADVLEPSRADQTPRRFAGPPIAQETKSGLSQPKVYHVVETKSPAMFPNQPAPPSVTLRVPVVKSRTDQTPKRLHSTTPASEQTSSLSKPKEYKVSDSKPKTIFDGPAPSGIVNISKPPVYEMPESKPSIPLANQFVRPEPTKREVVIRPREDHEPKRFTSPPPPTTDEKTNGTVKDNPPSWEDIFKAVVRARLSELAKQK